MYVNRDPFARTELHKRRVQSYQLEARGCDWCGGRDAKGQLWIFETQTASGRHYSHSGAFCCKRCHDAWHS